MNKDQFDDLLTKYVESMTQQPEVTTYIGENGNILDEPNIEDDETVDNYLQSTFDKTTGLWQYKSLSKHRPKDLLDEKLTKGTRLRMKLVIDSPTPDPTIDFKPN